MCGIELKKPSPEEEKEMRDELDRDFPNVGVENCVVLCDDCYKSIMSEFN